MRDLTQPTRIANPLSPVYSPESESSRDIPFATQLLISVRNAEEAALVRSAGVDWIDLKEPYAGALGRSSLPEARKVANLLSDHRKRSAALGELCDLDEQIAFEFAPLFPVLKVGLSRLGLDSRDWQTSFETLAAQLQALGSELIPVAYADWSICEAPSLQDVLQVALRVRASYLLIDTYIKDGRGLLDWLSLDDLQSVIQTARTSNCGIVLAGSLKISDVPMLLKLEPAALAVRGAVCQSDTLANPPASLAQPRTTPIDSKKVELWRTVV